MNHKETIKKKKNKNIDKNNRKDTEDKENIEIREEKT